MICMSKKSGNKKRVQVREGEVSATGVIPETLYAQFSAKADSMGYVTKRAIGCALYLFLKADKDEIKKQMDVLWEEHYVPLEDALAAQRNFGEGLGGGLTAPRNGAESGGGSQHKPNASR